MFSVESWLDRDLARKVVDQIWYLNLAVLIRAIRG